MTAPGALPSLRNPPHLGYSAQVLRGSSQVTRLQHSSDVRSFSLGLCSESTQRSFTREISRASQETLSIFRIVQPCYGRTHRVLHSFVGPALWSYQRPYVEDPCGCFYKFGVHFLVVLRIRPLFFWGLGLHKVRVPDFQQLTRNS